MSESSSPPASQPASQPASGDDASLHDMGGEIGAASIRGSGAKEPGGPQDDAAPQGGYARDMGPMAGTDEQNPGIAGSDESGLTDPVTAPVVAGAPSLYVDMDADESGRGADGDYEARLENKRAEQHHTGPL